MIACRLLLVGALLLGLSYAAEEPVTGSRSVPPLSSGDTVILTLPGAAPKPAPKPAPKEPAVAAQPAPAPAPPAPAPKHELPDAFKTDSSAYLQHVIGVWKKSDAEALLGSPARTRTVYDENKKVNGQIYAWPDPTGRYREIELDFESGSGALRTVFAYPKEMSWDDCRKEWGGNVNTTHVKNGRMFYSYLNRKLDVLVDPAGKVISLGLY